MSKTQVNPSGERVMNALDNFEKVIQDAIDIMAKKLTAKGGIITKNLSQNAQNNPVYFPLADKTKAKKKKKNKPFALVDTGKLKRMALSTTKGKLNGSKTITFKAKTPSYGKFHQPDGSEGAKKGTKVGTLPIRRFFEIKRADISAFNRVRKEAFKQALAKKGINLV